MTINEVRNCFPYLKSGMIYFNHASVGPLSTFAMEQVNNFLNERHLTKVNNFDTLLELDKSARGKLGALLNCRPDRLAWQVNVSSGINILAQGLDWKQGDRIILNDSEFPSNVYPFLNLKEYGVEVDFVKSRGGVADISDYEKLITPRTRLISISAVQFLSGYKCDLKTLGELCRSKGIIFCVDAIQGTGATEINAADADFIAGGSHKWLMGLQGLGYVYVSEELQERIKPKQAGWLSVENAWDLLDYDLDFRPDAGRYQTGTYNIPGLAALNGSLDLFNEFGFNNVFAKVKANSMYFIQKLTEAGFNPLLANVGEDNLSGIVTLYHNRAEQIVKELEKENIFCSIREGMIRFAPHYYNDKLEIDAVTEYLKKFV